MLLFESSVVYLSDTPVFFNRYLNFSVSSRSHTIHFVIGIKRVTARTMCVFSLHLRYTVCSVKCAYTYVCYMYAVITMSIRLDFEHKIQNTKNSCTYIF